jgi:hypothetical protein
VPPHRGGAMLARMESEWFGEPAEMLGRPSNANTAALPGTDSGIGGVVFALQRAVPVSKR